MDSDTGDHPPTVQKPYTLPQKHTQWVCNELEMLQKAGIISQYVFPGYSPIVIMPKKTHPGESFRNDCVLTISHKSLFPPVVKAHSKA